MWKDHGEIKEEVPVIPKYRIEIDQIKTRISDRDKAPDSERPPGTGTDRQIEILSFITGA